MRFHNLNRWCAVLAGLIAVGVSGAGAAEGAPTPPAPVQPFRYAAPVDAVDGIEVTLDHAAWNVVRGARQRVHLAFPVSRDEELRLEVEPFEAIVPNARFLSVRNGVAQALPRPDVFVARGRVVDEPGSHVFLAYSEEGPVNGYVQLAEGTRYFLSRVAPAAGAPLAIHRDARLFGVPEFEEFCGLHADGAVHLEHQGNSESAAARSNTLYGGPMLATVAVDADHFFVDLFNGNDTAAHAYIAQVIAAVSDIYIRDFDIRMVLAFARTWPDGDEPFAATNLSGFANYWFANEDLTGLNYVHMFSGSRNTSYGGIAYLTNPCSGSAFGISSILLGSFPQPAGPSHLGNWDVVVVAHEMGHNSGTLHTHDGYTPPIDQCGSTGAVARSDIMSYCHTVPGGLLNVDLRFHRRVQDVVAASTQGICLAFDCNANAVPDAQDILSGFSLDVNGNGIPDECEDCNENGILDPLDILAGAPDMNGNGIPDGCESDCNANGIPDEFEIAQGLAADMNGNQVPDECDPDCDGDGIADHVEIATGLVLDVDRNTRGDNCDDCDENGIVDYIDLERSHHIFVAQLADNVREYHRDSGVGIRTLGAGVLLDPHDAVFGPDRQLYVASFGNDQIVRINVDAGTSSVFVPAGSGGLDGPTALVFGPNGNLFVSSNLTNSVLEYNGLTGAFVQAFVTPGSGGLTGPRGLAFGPLGHLYVAGSDNTVRRYNAFTGAFMNVFVTAGSGGLSGPRAILFTPGNRLLVASFNNNSVLEYNLFGDFLRNVTPGITPTGAWGMRIGPNGNLFVARNTGQIRILEYDLAKGLYLRSFIRGDSLLPSPTGFDFRPRSPVDCNANLRVDACDISSGESFDCQPNGRPDECDLALGFSTDIDASGIPDECECRPLDPLPVESLGACTISAQCSGVSPCIAGRCYPPKNRYLSVVPGALAPGESFGIRVRHPASGRTWWVTAHQDGDPADVFRLGATRTCRFWDTLPAVIHITDCAIVPGQAYEVQTHHCACQPGNLALLSVPTVVPAAPDPTGPVVWGDCVGGFQTQTSSWLPPNGVMNVADIQAAVLRFQDPLTGPPLPWVDVHGETPNAQINVADIQQLVLAFQGQAYPYPAVAACP